MNFSLYIAKRYLFSKSSTNAINIITIIATFGVIVGATALFVILSGFSGLRTFSFSLLDASDPDVKISPVTGKTFFITPEIQETLNGSKEIKNFSRVVEERVFLKYKEKNHIANIKGVDGNYAKTIAIDSVLNVGTWIDPEFKNTVVIGNGISYKLSVGIRSFGEVLEIYVPKPGKGFMNPNNAFRSQRTQVIGVYNGSEEFRNKYVFAELKLAQNLLNYKDNQVSGIEIKLKDAENVNVFKTELQRKLDANNYKVETREELNALYYKVVNTENFISYLIFTLIVIIALFNVIGAIIMMIIDKKSNLKTLFNLGTSIQQIKKIFVLQGFLLTVVGLVIGLFLGVLAVLFQQATGFFKIIPSIPYPVEFRWMNLGIVFCTIIVLGFIAAKIASSRISEKFILK